MNNQWKMAPLETTAEMNEAGCQAYMEADGSTWVMHPSSMEHAYNAMLAAAPVPPAGDVEVLAWIIDEDGTIDATVRWEVAKHSFGHVTSMVSQAAHQAEVTHLTAERDGLLAKVERLGAEVLLRGQEERSAIEHLWEAQSELTKARACLKDLGVDWPQVSDLYQPATPIAHNADESCGQDAEAAKGGRDE